LLEILPPASKAGGAAGAANPQPGLREWSTDQVGFHGLPFTIPGIFGRARPRFSMPISVFGLRSF
jgi:hypothetical protein